ncbi:MULTISPECIES: nucleotidyl transferase AbiEii/AbiGii toxin family protein [Glaesserella]|uniref:Nucleotidyl transferase n=1 Tax=Glaesserella australis TaxID=2094024 RepID=A0A328BUV0_9PAST|nr:MULTISPECIES: nucleotidyl transferase AbiEii/AbiGii toxin family protein [Glaesserella]AUI65848.1 nucleotidyl transferase [Glaesserella sp. 15-184]RAL18006.1 nucleotidyl transferase [Glaesserella australis]
MNNESYFEIDNETQVEILQYYSNKLSMRDTILEKDIWLCWVLDVIFNIPNRHPMAFKGGTSLSKVFNAINRFSEDVDITLDYRFFDISHSFDPKMSKTKAKLFSEQLKESVKKYRDAIIVPALELALKDLSQSCNITVDDSGEKIWLSYPSVLSNSEQYIKESVLIELGGRNVIDPNEMHIVRPYVAQDNLEFKLPEPNITVLSPQRTFWEKATLIHVECHRGLRQNAERLSRHWYDLVKLYEQDIGQLAMDNHQLLEDVVNHKSIFFNASYANYSDCLNHKFKLLPDNNDLSELRKDYTEMNNAGMIYDNSKFTFEYIIEKIREISDRLNKTN